MKRQYLVRLMVLALALCLTIGVCAPVACAAEPNAVAAEKAKAVKVRSITLSTKRATLTVGETLTLKATVLPSNATNKKVTWKTSNSKVATVSSAGKVTAKKVGTATITCTAKDGSKKKATCKITVKKKTSTKATYRLLTITQENYSSGLLSGPHNDGIIMRNTYKRFNLGGVEFAGLAGGKDLSGQGIYNALDQLPDFYGYTDPIKSTDITFVFYSGHGAASDTKKYRGALCGVDGTVVTVDTVQKLLDKVPGTVVVILDSCLSGQYITSKGMLVQRKSLPTDSDMQNYSDAVIQAFAKSNATSKALTDSTNKKKYKILVAAKPLQSSWAVSIEGYPFGIFTYSLVKGSGLDPIPGEETKMHADANGNGKITLQEMYTYVDKQVCNFFNSKTKQNTQVWPKNDTFTLYAR